MMAGEFSRQCLENWVCLLFIDEMGEYVICLNLFKTTTIIKF